MILYGVDYRDKGIRAGLETSKAGIPYRIPAFAIPFNGYCGLT